MEGIPLGTEGSCEYIGKAVADSRQGLVPQIRGWEWDDNTSP